MANGSALFRHKTESDITIQLSFVSLTLTRHATGMYVWKQYASLFGFFSIYKLQVTTVAVMTESLVYWKALARTQLMRFIGTGNLDNNVHKNKNVLLYWWHIKQFRIIKMLWIKDARTSSILKLCILSKRSWTNRPNFGMSCLKISLRPLC